MSQLINYKLKYHRFIDTRLQRPLIKEKGYEIHHILPRSLGGTDHKDNLVKLSYREHFIAHRMLSKMHEGHKKYQMVYALDRWLKGKKYRPTSRTYEYIKSQISFEKAKQWQDPQFKAKMKSKIKKSVLIRWQDPEYRQKQMAGKQQQMAKAKAGMSKAWTQERKDVQLSKLWKRAESWRDNLTEDEKQELRKKNSEAVKLSWERRKQEGKIKPMSEEQKTNLSKKIKLKWKEKGDAYRSRSGAIPKNY